MRMRKLYISPRMEIIRMENEGQILAGSVKSNYDANVFEEIHENDNEASDDNLSKGHNFFWDTNETWEE